MAHLPLSTIKSKDKLLTFLHNEIIFFESLSSPITEIKWHFVSAAQIFLATLPEPPSTSLFSFDNFKTGIGASGEILSTLPVL